MNKKNNKTNIYSGKEAIEINKIMAKQEKALARLRALIVAMVMSVDRIEEIQDISKKIGEMNNSEVWRRVFATLNSSKNEIQSIIDYVFNDD